MAFLIDLEYCTVHVAGLPAMNWSRVRQNFSWITVTANYEQPHLGRALSHNPLVCLSASFDMPMAPLQQNPVLSNIVLLLHS